jgi:uncharacterized protein
VCSHLEYNCSRNEYTQRSGGPSVRTHAGRHPGPALWPRRSILLYAQIAREVDASVGAVQRELENLSKVGLIIRSSVGSQVFYQTNRDAPIFREMQALVNKTIGVFSVLRSALHPLSKRIVVAFVYGSVAREEERAVEKSIGRPINPTVYSVAEFKSKVASGNHFLNAVLKGKKIFLLGNEDELRKVGGVRLAKTRTDQSQ